MAELMVIARYEIAPGNEHRVHTLLPQLAEASRGEPGCLAFDAFIGVDDPRQVALLERYESREAFAAHRDTDHYRRLVAEGYLPLLASRTIEEFDAGPR
jgi:quinol monooxygenase YgiN